MNLLIDELPEQIVVNDKSIPLKTDYRSWVKFENSMTGNDEFLQSIIDITNGIYIDSDEFFKQILQFYQCGFTNDDKISKTKSTSQAVYDFEKDQYMIYTAFRQYYGIDLTMEQLHWWVFKQLFLELPDDSKIKKVMMYRSIRITSSMSKEQRQYYAEMKRLYALPDGKSVEQKAKGFGAILASGMKTK